MPRSTFLKLTAVCLVSATVPTPTAISAAVNAAQAIGLLERGVLSDRAGLTCANSSYTQCNKNNLPGNFCCPPAHNCVAFNNDQSAICCESGKDCSTISSISCDISKQNATASPESQLFTTNLQFTLPTCGDKCCPQGYACTGTQCALSNNSASAISSSSQAPTSTASSASASSTSKASSTANAAKVTNTQKPAETHHNSFPVTAVAVGLISGLALGIILTVIGMCCFGRRHRKEDEPDSPDISSVAASVSDPIYRPQDGFRSDFLRREPPKSTYSNRTSRVRSLFSRTPTMRSVKSFRSRDAPVDGIGRSIPAVPKTPVNQRSPEPSPRVREPSMESIKIYSPPNGGLGRPNTTFTDMMADAGLKQGEPYLGSPGRGQYHEQRWRDV